MFDNVHFDPKFGVSGMGIDPVIVDSTMQTCIGQYQIIFLLKPLNILNADIDVPISNIGINSLFWSYNWKYSTKTKIIICRANNLIFYTYFDL